MLLRDEDPHAVEVEDVVGLRGALLELQHVLVPAASAAPESEATPEVAWWERFGDPVLTDLIQRAARENRDVKIAAERVRAARAGETIRRSSLLPSFGATVSGVDNDPGRGATYESGSAGLDVSWEIDVAGGLRAGASAATYDRIATEDGARGVRLLVLTDVATN